MFDRYLGRKRTNHQKSSMRARVRKGLPLHLELLEVRTVPSADPTTTVLTSSAPSGADSGATLTYTALVTDTVNPINPTGSVTFSDGLSVLSGTPTYTAVGTNQLKATLLATAHGAGSHIIVATYNGDPNTAASNSSVLLETVKQPLVLSFANAEGATAASEGAGAPVTLEGFSPTSNALSGTNFNINSNASSGNALVISAPGSSDNQFEGYVNLSEDGRYLSLAGPDLSAYPTGTADVDASTAPRSIARVDVSGNVDLTTQDASMGTFQTDGAVSTNGSEFWDWGYTGNGIAANAIALGGTASTALQPTYQAPGAASPTPITSFNALTIAEGQLYGASFAPALGDPQSIVAIGSGTPTTTGQTTTTLTALNDSFDDVGNAFVFLKENPAITTPGPDTLYVAGNSSEGLAKYTFDGTNWNLVYTDVPTINGSSAGLRGLVVVPGDNGTATIYVLSLDMSTVLMAVDNGTGAKPTFSTLATTNTVTNGTWNGLAPAPFAVANATTVTVSANQPITTAGQPVTLTAAVTGYSVSSTPGSTTGDDVVFTVVRGGIAYSSNPIQVTASSAQGTGFASAAVNATNFPSLPGGALQSGDQITATFTPAAAGPFAAFGNSTSPVFTESVVATGTTTTLAPVSTTLGASTTTTAAVTATGKQTVTVAAVSGLAVGAMLSVDTGANSEVVTVTAVSTTSPFSFTAVFAKTHASGVSVVSSVPVAGSFPVAVGSLTGIVVGSTLTIDSGANSENVVVTATNSTAKTITASFTKTHSSGVSVAVVNTNSPLGIIDAFTATVTPATGGPPTGTVTFFDNGSPFAVATLAASGTNATATATIQIPSMGTYNITATYNGSTSFAASSTSTATSQTVITGNTTTTLAVVSYPTTNPLETGSLPIAGSSTTPITLTATVRPAGTIIFVPSGTVQFLDNGVALGAPVTLSATGTATISLPSYASPVGGANAFTVSFTSGTPAMFNNSTSTATTVTLVANGTSLSLTSSITSGSGFTSGLSTPITLTATVSPAGATGTVDFFDGNVKLDSTSVTVNPSTGTATLNLSGGLGSVTGTIPGAQYLGAIYVPTSGNTYAYAMTTTPLLDPNTGAPLSTTIKPIAPGDVIVTQVGDGFTNNSALAQIYGLTASFFTTDVFLDEINPVTHALVQRIGLPDEDVGSTIHALTVENSDTLEGDLELSTAGLYVTLGGYDAPPFSNAASATTPIQFRTVAQLNLATGVLDTSTQLGGGASEINTDREIRDTIQVDGSTPMIYVTEGASASSQSNGIYLVPFGTNGSNNMTDQTVLNLSGTPNSVAGINIINNNLYVTTPFTPQVFDNVSPTGALNSGMLPGLNLPQSQDLIAVPGLSPGGASGSGLSGNTSEFVFFATGTQGASPDLLYIADRSNGLLKFAYNGTQWVSEGAFTTGFAAPQGLGGYIDPVSGAVVLYGTTGGNTAVRIVDASSRTTAINNTTNAPTLTVMSTTANANLLFRGLAYNPATQAPAFTSGTSTTFMVGTAGSFTVTASGSPFPDFSETGALPSGVTLNGATGVLSGTPAAGTGGVYHITITAANGIGTPATQSFTLTVLGVSPTVLPNWTVNTPGYSQTITATGGTAPYTFSSTAGTLPTGLTLSTGGVLSGTPTAAGSYTFTVTAKDSTGLTISQSYTVVINPAVTITTTTLANGTAGTAYSQTITATGGTGALTFTTLSPYTPPPGLTLSSSGVLSGTPTTAGIYNYTVMATDAVGYFNTQTYNITISVGAFAGYNVTVVGSSTIQAGSNFLVTVQAADSEGNPITSYSGPSSVTATISPTSTASSFPTTGVPINSFGFGFFLADLQKVGTYTITAANGSLTGSASPVTIVPGSAVKLGIGVQPVNTPTGVTLPAVTVQVLDAFGNVVTTDSTDSVTVGIASGPGSFKSGSTTTATVHNGVATFSNLTLVVPGSYTLSELVPSLYTGPSSASFTVAPLQVVSGSFASSSSGFSLQFNAPFLVNSTTPVLYGQGFGATAPAPSVTLTQTKNASGNPITPIVVEGSVVLNTATNSLIYVETDTASFVNNNSTPILPDGTYKVDVRGSGATGLQALNSGGGFLDGLGNGTPGSGDYTTTFTVGATAAGDDVVWVPDTADGPGQPLEAPGANQVGGGYPVYLDDTHGNVTNVQVTVNYNPALLTVTGVTGAGFSLLASSTPGQANLQYSGPALPMGAQTPIGFITAKVPSGTAGNPAPYKAKDLLHLSGVSVNSGLIPTVTADGLHVVAYVGNASGSGSYSSNDAVLITRVALQTDTGFAAYPLIDPVIVADTDGSGFVPADAPLQVNEAGVGFPTFNLANPPIPNGVVFQAIANNVDPTLGIQGSGVRGQGSGEVVTVSVNIDDADPAGSTGLIRANLALTYDPIVFNVSAADIHLGSVLTAGSGWSVVPTINPITGEIAIALSSATPISSTIGGSLVTIDFHAISGEPGGVSPRSQGSGVRDDGSALTPDPSPLTPILLVASVDPSGQHVVLTELEDAQGSFVLTPAPSNGFDPRIDGVVTLAATPTAAPLSALAVESAVVTTPPLLENQTTDSSPLDLPAVETTRPPLAVVAVESSDQTSEVLKTSDVIANSAATLHGAVIVASSAASTSLGTLISAPFVGLVFQFGSVPAVSATAAGVNVGQHVADQWFLALARGTASPLDPVQLVGTVRDAFERVLAGQLRLTQAATDDLDSLNWDDVSSDLDCQGVELPTAQLAPRGRRDGTVHETPTPAVVEPTAADRAALNQYFAQAGEDTDQIPDDE